MGTQQILLIVLSVIIVGAAIAVGIQMFNSQAYSANKSAIAADAQSFATQVVQYYKTPESQGGAGGKVVSMTAANVFPFIGWSAVNTNNDSGDYIITDASAAAADGSFTVAIYGLGKEIRATNRPAIETVISFPDGTITATPKDVTSTTAIAGVPALFTP
ncbi:MAG: hypothetical protein WCY84_01820 [Candidatus Cloacimonadaceae bacterium]